MVKNQCHCILRILRDLHIGSGIRSSGNIYLCVKKKQCMLRVLFVLFIILFSIPIAEGKDKELMQC